MTNQEMVAVKKARKAATIGNTGDIVLLLARKW